MRVIKEDYLIEMANIRGKDMKREDIDFSFFFSRKYPNHACRIKICWNRNKMTHDTGVLELHGDYRYTQDYSCEYTPDSVEIATARYFAKKYKVLFSAVWEEKLDPNDLTDYFRCRMSFDELLDCFQNLSSLNKSRIKSCNSIKELEQCVIEYGIFNMND